MKCIFCNFDDTQVIDTRISDDKLSIKRRRRCTKCDRRFNTLEKIELQMPTVIKSSNTREDYSEEKLKNSVRKALHKRPVSSILFDQALDSIRQKILTIGEREISSRLIGDMVMTELAKLDKVAYIRFASIYRSFKDVTDFSEIIEQLHKNT